MENKQIEKLRLVTGHVLIVGIDVSKRRHTARFLIQMVLSYAKALNFTMTGAD